MSGIDITGIRVRHGLEVSFSADEHWQAHCDRSALLTEVDRLTAERDRARDTAARYEEELALKQPVIDAVMTWMHAPHWGEADSELFATVNAYRAAVSGDTGTRRRGLYENLGAPDPSKSKPRSRALSSGARRRTKADQ
jgi:hypothetical protein